MSKQFLIIGPSWVGDMVMAQALFKLIKHKEPDCFIDVLAPQWSIPVLNRMPQVRSAILLPINHGEFKFAVRLEVAKKLKIQNYDHAIVLANSWKSALIPFFAKIPLRTGWLGELRFGLLTDWRRLDKKVFVRMVDRYLQLGYSKDEKYVLNDNSFVPKLTVDFDNQVRLIKQFNLPSDKKIIALCPGAAFGPTKRWPEEYFIEVGNKMIADGWQVWLFGSAQDQAVIDKIVQGLNQKCINFAGKIDLFATIDLLALVTLAVSNDSGLLHIAASVDRPVIAIYGSTSPDHTPPLTNKAHIISSNIECRPCFKPSCKFGHINCMRQINPELITSVIGKLT